MKESELYVFNFEKLDVWSETLDLTKMVYKLTVDFPSNEIYGLVSQMRRAAVSVSSNIAEGSVRATMKDKIRFYEIAIASLMELLNQAIISKELGFISLVQYREIRVKIEQISRMLYSLRKSQM